ncbi:MAG: HAD family phosphatase [Clostridia bacterium]|nr:HAD family phosphatase [Clostridia bacterium]
MKKIKYPLVFSDFDGTLLRSDDTLAEETKATISKYVQDGGIFVLSSGRMTPSILKQARALSLTGLLSAYNGSEVVDIQSGERLFQGNLPKQGVVNICRLMESLGLHIHVYDGDNFYSNTGGEILKMYEHVCQVTGIVVDDMPLSQFVEEKNLNIVKVVALVAYEEREKIYAQLDDAFGKDYLVLRSAKFLIEICDKRYSKGTALRYIAEKYGIPLEKTIAVGDNQNDLSMLQTAGLGLAVANGEASLKGKVPFFEYSNDENAVGRIIENYAYTEDEK